MSDNWKMVPLIEAATLQRGFDLPVQHRVSGDVPVFAANGPVGTHNEPKVQGPGVVTGRSGTIGKVHYVDCDYWPLNTSLFVNDFHGNHPKFVFYLLSQLRLERFYEGTGVPTLNRNNIHGVEVPLPPLSEQKRIADILDKADAIRRKRWSALASIEEVIQSTFMQTVGPAADGFLSWPVKEIHELVASHKGAMRTGPFGSTLKHSEFVDSGVAVLGIDNAVTNRFAWDQRRFISPEKYEDLRVYTVHPGDVLITIMATTGRSAVVPDDIPLAINTKHLACITLDRRMAEPEFISQAIHRHPVVLTQLGASGRGAIMNGLNLGIIKQIKIPIPPIELQREFASSVARLRLLESQLQAASNEGENLLNSLVQRAFKGEL